jgi:hypothetical protein
MGAVPVVLDSNPFAVGLDDEGGALAVASVEDMPAAVMALLGDEARLGELAKRGMRTSSAQIDWDIYVARVDDALRRPAREDPAREARAEVGKSLMARETAMKTRLARKHQTVVEQLQIKMQSLEMERDRLERQHRATVEQLRIDRQAALAHIGLERDRMKRERNAVAEQLRTAQAKAQAMMDTRAWRLARAFWRARAHIQHVAARIENRPNASSTKSS